MEKVDDLLFFNNLIDNFESLTSKDDLFEKLNQIICNLNYSINKSIIEGEYINNNTVYKNYRAKFIELSSVTEDFGHIKDVKRFYIKQYLDIISYQINSYQLFVEKINRLYTQEVPIYIDIELFLNNKNRIFKSNEALFKIFEYNIELSKIDHHFVNKESLLKNLFRLTNDITNIRISKQLITDDNLRENFIILKEALLLKTSFLIDKWYARSENKQKDSNNKYIEILKDKGILNYSTNPTLEKYKKKIIYLYSLPGYSYDTILKKEISQIDSKKNLEDLSFFDLHTLVKYNKDVINDTAKLKKLAQTFSKKSDQAPSDNIHINFAHKISKQYCLNNYFSSYCNDFINSKNNITYLEQNLEEFKKEYLEIKKESKDLSNNFFLDFKFILYSVDFLNKILDSNKENTYEIIKKSSNFFNSFLNDIIQDFDTKIQWSLKNNNYIFKLPFEESLINHKSLTIYLSSSFLLPKTNDSIREANNLINIKYQKLRLVYNAEYQIHEIQKLKEEYKSDNKRIIELVSIFAAVISFIVGSIGGFKFITDIYSAIAFTTIFGICLTVFLLLIMRLLRKNSFGSFWDFGFLLLLLAFIAIIALNMQKATNSIKHNTEQDVSNTIKLKIENT